MTPLRQYLDLVVMHLRIMRAEALFIGVVQLGLTVSLVIGFGYVVPDIQPGTAVYLVTGTATQAVVTIGLVVLPQLMAQARTEGRHEYVLAQPVSREAYLGALVTVAASLALPGVVLAVVVGWWRYDLSLDPQPAVIPAAGLAVLSLAGVGVAMAVYSPHQQVTNALTQLIIFYVLFFAPVILPREQLPGWLQSVAVLMPPTYAADAIRASLTDIPGTHLGRSLLLMSGFSVASLGAAVLAMRRRG